MDRRYSSEQLKKKILPYRQQEKIMDGWLKKRLDTIIPMIMKRWDSDMWIIMCKEYNEDPMLSSLTPCAMINARRSTILAFVRDGEQVKRFSITRPNVGLDEYYESIWTMSKDQDWGKLPQSENSSVIPETQMECLKRIIETYKPKNIALNYADDFAFGDGLSSTMKSQLCELIEPLQIPIIDAQKLCVSWLETRLEEELSAYQGIVEIAHAIIQEAFSSQVIMVGVTTNHDVKYYMIQRMLDLGLTPWFDTEVSIKRRGGIDIEQEEVIMPNDLLHCDMGFRYLGLCTDTQEIAYVLAKGEDNAPVGLIKGMETVNRLQDIVIENFIAGRSGNEILKKAREQAIAEHIEPCIYTHPIGYHGHGAGPTIGLWDMQDGVHGLQGSYPLFNNTSYALELNARVCIEEWDNEFLQYPMETDIIFSDDHVYFAAPRQMQLHLIK